MADLDPREMAAAPKGNKGNGNGSGRAAVASAPRQNRWLTVFGPASQTAFKSVNRQNNEPLQLNDGSTQTRLAQVIIPFAVPGAYVAGAYVIRRVFKDGTSILRLQWPSSGGKFKTPMIDTSDDEHSANDLQDYGDQVVDEWKRWRRAQIAAGNVAGAAANVHGTALSKDEMQELGLT